MGFIVTFIFFLLVGWLDYASAQPTSLSPNIKLGPDRSLIAPMKPTERIGGALEGIIPNARVYKDVYDNTISSIEGTISIPGAVTAQQAIEAFLSTNSSLLGLSSSLAELQLKSNTTDGSVHRIRYNQIYGGLPVIDSRVSALIRNDLIILTVDLDIIPITPPPPPQNFNPTNSAQAIQVALKALKGTWVTNPQPSTEALIRVVNGTPTVVWKVYFANDLLLGWEPLINANTLQVIEVRDLRVID